jgi:hypothetical protein
VKKPLSVAAIATFTVLTRASACIPAPADQLFGHDAEFILVGTATGTQEEHFELTVSYEVSEVLSGIAPDTRAGISPCHDPIRNGERVVVGSVKGQQYVYPAEAFEQKIRTTLRTGR